MDTIKLILIDSDRSWLKTAIMSLGNEPDFFIVGIASNKTGAIELVKTQDADIVLMDIEFEEQSHESVSVIEEINQHKEIKVIVIAANLDEQLMAQALLAGAVDYCLKDKFESIPGVIRQAHYHISPVHVLLKEYYKLKRELVLHILSPAENEVFELLLKDCSLAQMGYRLNKAEGTIKNQVNAIFKKLHVKNRRQMIEKFSFLNRGVYPKSRQF